jgi:hypothetical protein
VFDNTECVFGRKKSAGSAESMRSVKEATKEIRSKEFSHVTRKKRTRF